MNINSNLFKELTDNEIRTIIKVNFQTDILSEIRLVAGGLFNTTYKICYGIDNKNIILRVGPVNRHLLMAFEENLMKAEEYVYEICNKNNIPCSKVLVCDVTKKLINRDYMIVEYIESTALSMCSMNEKEKAEVYKEVGRYISKLHSITNESFGRVSYILAGKTYFTWYDYLISEIDDITGRLQKLHAFTQEEVNNIKLVYEKNKIQLESVTTPTLIHTDLWEGNVLVEKNDNQYNVVGIIDSDRAIFGDVDFEFASQWMINDNFMKGYTVNVSIDKVQFSKSQIKTKIYLILYSLIECYVGLAQYNDMKQYQNNKKTVLNLVSELLS